MENLTPQLLAHVMIAVSGMLGQQPLSLSHSFCLSLSHTHILSYFFHDLIYFSFNIGNIYPGFRTLTVWPSGYPPSCHLNSALSFPVSRSLWPPCVETSWDVFLTMYSMWPFSFVLVTNVGDDCLSECEYVIQHCCGEAKGSDTYNSPTYFSIIAEAFLQYHSLSDNELYSDE